MSRSIRDFRLGTHGGFEGRANIFARSDDLILEETGRLQFVAHEAAASQHYILTLKQTRVAQVKFADGSPFYELDLSSGAPSFLHRCGNDTYHGHYLVKHRDRFYETWRVMGPRKDYCLVTRFTRPG